MPHGDWTFVVGIYAPTAKEREQFADVLRDSIMEYTSFVTDVLDYDNEQEDEDPQPNQDGRTFK